MDVKQAVVEGWSWLGCTPDEVLHQNSFGNIIFVDTTGRCWRLMPEELKGEVIARGRSELEALMHDASFREDWLMEDFCKVAEAALGKLAPGDSYCLKLPAVFGHPYAAENMGVIATTELIRASGELARQIMDLPDGTPVDVRVD